MVKRVFLLQLIFIPLLVFAQKESNIKIDSGKQNNITVIQQGKDTSQKSYIGLIKSDSNKLKVHQSNNTSTSTETTSRFVKWMSNARTFFLLLVSILTVIILVFRLIPFLKKYFKKRRK